MSSTISVTVIPVSGTSVCVNEPFSYSITSAVVDRYYGHFDSLLFYRRRIVETYDPDSDEYGTGISDEVVAYYVGRSYGSTYKGAIELGSLGVAAGKIYSVSGEFIPAAATSADWKIGDELVVTAGFQESVDTYPSWDVATYPITLATACIAPTKVNLATSSVAPGTKVKLSWSGAKAGKGGNSIVGYKIYRATDPDGPYSLLNTVSSTATSGSYTVTAPTTNGKAYYYKVITLGSQSGYNSGFSDAYATLSCDFASVTAPTSVSLAVTNAAPGAEVEMSWAGASAGTNNAITGYEVYRSSDPTGEYSLFTTVSSTAGSGSTMVTTPTTNLESCYYKVRTLGALEGCDSGLSIAYATLTCTYSTPSAPKTVTVNGESSVYALPGSTVTLAWSGASGGANNPITSYSIYRDGKLFVAGIDPTTDSYEAVAHDTTGNAYSYAVVADGDFSSSAPSKSVFVYAYTDPVAPTEFFVSNDSPSINSRVTLSWSGAAAGGYNDIVGYRVYRSEEVNGTYKLIETVTTKETTGSCFIDAYPLVGGSYYYRIETIGSYSVSGLSEMYLQLTSSNAEAPDSDITVIVKPVPRSPRKMVFGEYDTVYDGPWTLCEWAFSEPETQTMYVEVIGRMAGPLDLSTYLTGGDPRYGSRELEARFECSEGTRLEREELISAMTNKLHGQQVDITLPDDDTRYVTGRLHVQKDYNDMAHASVTVTAVCNPWRYSKQETVVGVHVVEASQEFVLSNSGRRRLVPTVTVSGHDARVHLTCGDHAWVLETGEYRLPELVLRNGNTVLSCYGSGLINFSYREAVL